MIHGVHHLAIGVPDFDRGLRFYCDLLGFEVVQDMEIRDFELANRAVGLDGIKAKMAMLRTSNTHIELWQYEHPDPRERGAVPSDYGYVHFALQVTGIEEEYERLKEAGMEFVGEPVDFGVTSAIYGRDPFGNVIELYEIRDARVSQIPNSES